MKRRRLISTVCLVLAAAAAFLVWVPRGKAFTKRALDALGIAKLEVLDIPPGFRLTFEPDPSHRISSVEGDLSQGVRIGDGPVGFWSTDYPAGGIVRFADGSEAGFSHLRIWGDSTSATVSP